MPGQFRLTMATTVTLLVVGFVIVFMSHDAVFVASHGRRPAAAVLDETGPAGSLPTQVESSSETPSSPEQLPVRRGQFPGVKLSAHKDDAGIVRYVYVDGVVKSRKLADFIVTQVKSYPGLRRVVLTRIDDIGRVLEAFSDISSLEELSLSKLSASPADFRVLRRFHGLKKLSIWDLSNDLSAQSIDEITRLGQLESLSISDCQFRNEHTSKLGSLKNLRELGFHKCPISAPDWVVLGKLPALRTLRFKWTRISTPGMKGVGAISQVTDLCLEKNGVFDVSLSELATLKNLTRLDLDQNRIRGEGLAAFDADSCPIISLHHNPIDHHLVPHLSRLFDSLSLFIRPETPLSFPDFATAIGEQIRGVEVEEDELMSKDPTIRLKLESKDLILSQRFTTECLEALNRCPNVESLTIKENRCLEGAVVSLDEAAQLKSVTIEEVELSDNTLLTLGSLPNLNKLELSSGTFTQKGLEAIARSTSLKQLVINGATIDGDTLGMLARCPELTHLTLREVQSDVGFAGLSELASVEHLDLAGCQLTTVDARAVSAMSRLQSANFSDTGIDNRFLFQLRILERLRSLDVMKTQVSLLGLEFAASRLPSLRLVSHRYSRVRNSDAQSLANRFGWSFQGDCSCGCMDLSPQRPFTGN